MLRYSFEILPLAALMPSFVVAVLVIVASAVVIGRRADVPAVTAPLLELAIPFLIPVLILAWGLRYEHADRSDHGTSWHLWAVTLVSWLQVLPAIWLLWRHRSRMWLAAGFIIAANLWANAATFVAAMALTDTWI